LLGARKWPVLRGASFAAAPQRLCERQRGRRWRSLARCLRAQDREIRERKIVKSMRKQAFLDTIFAPVRDIGVRGGSKPAVQRVLEQTDRRRVGRDGIRCASRAAPARERCGCPPRRWTRAVALRRAPGRLLVWGRSSRSAGALREAGLELDDCLRSCGVPLGRGALEEAQRLIELPRHALAVNMTHGEVEERFCVALRRGEAPSLHGFGVRLRRAPSVVEHLAEVGLAVRESLLGCASVPLRGGL
jgi:hypothetical protein